jgi:rhodanese-related sulfurtransferase
MRHLACAIVFGINLTIATICANGIESDSTTVKQSTVANEDPRHAEGEPSYCGIYALYRGLSALGMKVELSDLVNTKYIGSIEGSSISELTQAAADYGVKCKTLSHMNCGLLSDVHSPTILHAKASFGSEGYSHWILFMGIEDGKARIYDGNGPAQIIEFTDLAPRWDGIGLILSNKPNDTTSLLFDSIEPYLLFCALVMAIVGLLSVIERRLFLSARWDRSITAKIVIGTAQAGALLLLSILSWYGYSYINTAGFLESDTAIKAIEVAHTETFLPKLKVTQISSLVANNEVTLIDARLVADYDTGHIKGAINLPPNLSNAEIYDRIKGLSKRRQLTVYCQSRGCPFAIRMAARLKDIGYSNLSILEGGWIEWQQYQRNESTSHL